MTGKTEINEKSTLVKDVLFYLAVGGGVLTALSISPALLAPAFVFAHQQKLTKKAAQNTFYHLKRNGWIHVERRKGRISIMITDAGRKHIAKSSILNVKPLAGKKWDKTWRIVSYDIPARHSEKRDALRLLLRRLGFMQLHKSVWINPYDCRAQLEALTIFFKLDQEEVRLIAANDIGDAMALKKAFKL